MRDIDTTYSAHREKLERIVSQLKQANRTDEPFDFRKDAISHFVPNPYRDPEKVPRIDLGSLNEVLEIDEEGKTCVAEPGLTFSELVERVLPLGLIPCTVPELKTITIGGAVAGCSLESMSYKYGGFHDSCMEYEVVSGRGEVFTCSREKDPELFQMIHGSYGTLGILSRITFRLLPARPFVRMENRLFQSFGEFWAYLREKSSPGEHDFVDAIVHGPEKFVVCLGTMVEDPPYTNSYDWLKIYYKSTLERREDYLETCDYFFRYDTECHWLSRTVPLLEMAPVRLLAGKFVLGSSNIIKWSNRLRPLFRMKRRPDVVVDVFIPQRNFEIFYRWYEREFDFWPLWIVPYRAPEEYPWISDEHRERINDSLLIDCAIYGKPNDSDDVDYSELLERKTFELDGIKTLISRNHYDENRFWKIYSKPRYDEMKARMDSRNLFGTLYEKFNPRQYLKDG